MSQPSCELPQKLFYRIQEVSRITGVKPYVLRYWETEFASLRPEKGQNDQRRYRPEDIELVQKIKRLLYEEKFTIAGARQHIEGGSNDHTAPVARPRAAKRIEASPRPSVDSIARRLNRVRQEMVELQAFLAG
jgi:DNA-binding transcriptional MerR regulator